MGWITREEVSKEIKDALDTNGVVGKHALRVAIEALKEPKIIRCKDCKYYHENVWAKELGVDQKFGNIIVAHHGCDRWTKDMNCVTPEGFCFLAEMRTDD